MKPAAPATVQRTAPRPLLRRTLPCILAVMLLSSACASSDENGSSESALSPGDPSGSAPSTTQVDCNAEWDETSVALEQEVFQRVNQVRAAGATCGAKDMPPMPAFSLNVILTCTSRAHSRDMAERNYFDHTNPDGESPFDRMQAAGYDFRGAGENIALGQRTAESVMESWLSSPGHCSNIMSDHTDFGIGHYSSSDGKAYWTQNFGRL